MLLETEGLTKQFGELTAVDEVNLQLQEGDSLSIIG
ncbi:MAG: ABC-type branched-subunit amino acid transport system ATPase component, partial [Natronomonas sp.]